MRRGLLILSVALMSAALLLVGCGQNDQKKEANKAETSTSGEVKKAVPEAAAPDAQIEKLRADAAARLADMDKKLAELEGKAATLKDAAQAKARKSLDDLKPLREGAAARLAELKAAGKDAATGAAASYDEAMGKLSEACAAAAKSLDQ